MTDICDDGKELTDKFAEEAIRFHVGRIEIAPSTVCDDCRQEIPIERRIAVKTRLCLACAVARENGMRYTPR